MKTIRIIPLLLSCALIFACGTSEVKDQSDKKKEYVNLEAINMESLTAEIKKREEALDKDEQGMENGKGQALMDAYVAYANRFSNYENAAEYLFKAGEIAMSIDMTVEAIKYFDKVYNEFRDFDRRPYALFLKAFVLENQAHNLNEAQKTYELFISEYPSHEMADDAKYSIENMGKSPEELIREFEIRDSINQAKESV